ncbi:MAG: hypothetical protein AAF430_05375 [Myxococcota bacterium]
MRRTLLQARSARAAIVIGLYLLAWSLPASALVVEFDATYSAGLGDGGNPATLDVGANGRPICNKGLQPHLNASVPGHGFAELGATAPRSLMAVRPFHYGVAGPTTGNATIMAKPGIAGLNGFARYTMATCEVTVPPHGLPVPQVDHTWIQRFTAPANHAITTTTTPMGRRSFMANLGILESHHLRAEGGPGTFSFVVPESLEPAPWTGSPMQGIQGAAGPNTFGGGWRASGGGRQQQQVNAAPGVVISGYWLSGPWKFGHNEPVNTELVSAYGVFTNLATMGTMPLTLRVWNARFTTGVVKAEDNGGQFITIRTQTGGDNRTGPHSSMGTLLLVTPWTASVIPFLGVTTLHFGGTATLRFEFLPEPEPTALFALGAMTVLALHFVSRRDR